MQHRDNSLFLLFEMVLTCLFLTFNYSLYLTLDKKATKLLTKIGLTGQQIEQAADNQRPPHPQTLRLKGAEYPDEQFKNCKFRFVFALKLTTTSECLFEECELLKEVYIPLLTSVGYCAFGGCTSLESFSAPLLKEGFAIFFRCEKLNAVYTPLIQEPKCNPKGC